MLISGQFHQHLHRDDRTGAEFEISGTLAVAQDRQQRNADPHRHPPTHRRRHASPTTAPSSIARRPTACQATSENKAPSSTCPPRRPDSPPRRRNTQVTLTGTPFPAPPATRSNGHSFPAGLTRRWPRRVAPASLVTGLTNGSTDYFVVSATSNSAKARIPRKPPLSPPACPPRAFRRTSARWGSPAAPHSLRNLHHPRGRSGCLCQHRCIPLLYQAASGDCSVTGRVQSLTNTNVSAKTGS